MVGGYFLTMNLKWDAQLAFKNHIKLMEEDWFQFGRTQPHGGLTVYEDYDFRNVSGKRNTTGQLASEIRQLSNDVDCRDKIQSCLLRLTLNLLIRRLATNTFLVSELIYLDLTSGILETIQILLLSQFENDNHITTLYFYYDSYGYEWNLWQNGRH
jgi:hypothetical protein